MRRNERFLTTGCRLEVLYYILVAVIDDRAIQGYTSWVRATELIHELPVHDGILVGDDLSTNLKETNHEFLWQVDCFPISNFYFDISPRTYIETSKF